MQKGNISKEALYLWFKYVREKALSISGPLFREKLCAIKKEIKVKVVGLVMDSWTDTKNVLVYNS